MSGPRRVVVTGLGAITPLGLTAPTTWEAMLAGHSGIERVTAFDTTTFSVKIGGEVRGFKAEERTISGLIATPNQVEAVTAYFEKRDPVFADRDGA